MGLRYSIMGFKQEEVLKLQTTIFVKTKKGEDEPKKLSLDLNDLLIIKQIADFPNRKNILRVVVSGKEYYWVSYKQLINELPILGIKRQALADRLDKICILGVLERYADKSSSVGTRMFFRMGDKYESLIYDNDASQPAPGVVDYDRGSSELPLIYNLKDNNSILSKERENNPLPNFESFKNGTKELSSVEAESRLQDKKEKNSAKRERSGAPSNIEEVHDYFKLKGFRADEFKFWNYYQARGWEGIKDWKALADLWESREKGEKPQPRGEKKIDSEYEEFIKKMEER